MYHIETKKKRKMENKIIMNKKIAKIVCTSLLLTMIIATNVFAAGKKNYKAYKLPAFQKNNYSGTHIKENTRDYITNQVNAISHTGTVTFWAANAKHTQISEDYYQKEGNMSKLKFKTRGYNKKGKQVCMGMENYDWSFGTAFVSGWANFH